MRKYSRIYAEINLDAIDSNLRAMKEKLADDISVCAVIKADGYGHGALQIARHIQHRPYIWGFACATVEEAMQLRSGGIMKPIVLLGFAFPESYDDIIDYDIRACIFDYESAAALSQKSMMLEHPVKIHLAVDTGMGRIGFLYDREESINDIVRIAGLPNLEIEGMFTHFARADEVSLTHTEVQLIRYLDFEGKLKQRGIEIPIRHTSNSAAIMRFPEAHLNMVRAGIILYGLPPSEEMAGKLKMLRPAMKLVSHVSNVKTVPAETPISYGGTYVTKKESVIATIPVGYADGYPRSLSGRGFVLIHGTRVPIRGRVCMDQFMVDVSELKDVKVGDECVLIGTQEEQEITILELAALSGRFHYEIPCDISKRVPRSYSVNGYTAEQVDYFH